MIIYTPENLSFEVIDLQDNFVVINKAADTNFHDENELGKGLFNQVKKHLQLDELFPVHRLDKMTSGLIIFATNHQSAQQFQLLFSKHSIEKYYLAISDKKPNKKQGLIKGDMVKSRRGAWKLLRSMHNPAISQFFSYTLKDGKRLYLIKPHSGKTHQIRVALSSIGAPIIGDSYYYPATKIATTTTTQLMYQRGYLHAFALRFTLNNQNYQYIVPPNNGDEFINETVQLKINDITPPWQLNWPKVSR